MNIPGSMCTRLPRPAAAVRDNGAPEKAITPVTPEQSLMRLDSLVVGYHGRALLPPIDLEVRPGELWALIGRNGSGKTTLFRTMLGLIPAVGGRVTLQDPHRVAYIAQRVSFDALFPLQVSEVVAHGTMNGWSFLRPRGSSVKERVARALDAVDAGELAPRLFRTLSEGQKQRVLLARMVASDAKLVLLDEPTAAMDAVAEQQTLELLARLQRDYGLSVIVVSHHLSAALSFADRALFIDPDHEQAVAGTVTEVRANPAFGRRYEEAELTEDG